MSINQTGPAAKALAGLLVDIGDALQHCVETIERAGDDTSRVLEHVGYAGAFTHAELLELIGLARRQNVLRPDEEVLDEFLRLREIEEGS